MKDMKQILLKFSRSIDRHPTPPTQVPQDSSLDWPNDVVRLECVAQHLRSVCQHVSKKAHLCYPSMQLANLNAPLSLEGSNTSGSAHTATNGSRTNGIFANRRSKSEGVALADDRDKRLHRLPEAVLARLLLESADRFEETACSVNLRSMFRHLGSAMRFLADSRMTVELEIEQDLLHRLHQCAYLQVPALIKGRKHFCKLYLEWRNVSQRLHSLETAAAAQQQQEMEAVAALQSSTKSSEMCKSQNSLTSVNGILKSASGAIKSVKNGAKEKRSHSKHKGASPRLEISAPMSMSSNSEGPSPPNTALPLHVNIGAESSSGGRDTPLATCSPTSDDTNVSNPMSSSQQSTGSPVTANNNTTVTTTITGATASITPTVTNHVVAEKAKVHQLRMMKEELELSLTQTKDQALKDFYRFDCSLVSYGETFLSYLCQLSDYHRKCADYLDEVARKMREEMAADCKIPVFGRLLEEHLEMTNRTIAYVIEVCCRELCSPRCLLEEGIFRTAGSKVKVDTLVSALNVMRADSIIQQSDPYVIADALKQYLRSLPVSLLCNHMRDDWHLSIQLPNIDDQLRSLWNCCCRLPSDYWYNLGYVMRLLQAVSMHSLQNRMTAANLGIVLAPTLLPSASNMYHDQKSADERCHERSSKDVYASKTSGCENLSAKLAAGSMSNLVIELLITYANSFFPEDVEQYLVLPPTSTTPVPTYATVRRVPAKGKGSSAHTKTVLPSPCASHTGSSGMNVASGSLRTSSDPKKAQNNSYSTSVGPVRATFSTKRHTSFSSGNKLHSAGTGADEIPLTYTASLHRRISSRSRSPSPTTTMTNRYPFSSLEDEDNFGVHSYSLGLSSRSGGLSARGQHRKSGRRTSEGHLIPKLTDTSITSQTAPDSEAEPDTLDDGDNLPSDHEDATSSCHSVNEGMSMGTPGQQRYNRSFHTDMYDTLFALQSIRSNPWIIANNISTTSGASCSPAHSAEAPLSVAQISGSYRFTESSPADFIQRMRRVYEERQFSTSRSSISDSVDRIRSRDAVLSPRNTNLPWPGNKKDSSNGIDRIDRDQLLTHLLNNSNIRNESSDSQQTQPPPTCARRIVRSKAALSMVLPNQTFSRCSTSTTATDTLNVNLAPNVPIANSSDHNILTGDGKMDRLTSMKNTFQRHSMPSKMLTDESSIPSPLTISSIVPGINHNDVNFQDASHAFIPTMEN